MIALVSTLVAASAGLWLAIVALSVLFVAWVVSLFALLVDSISVGAEVLWFVALTCLAPIAIPVYFVLRRRRRAVAPTS
jgi:hypothetical protein